MKHTHIVMNYLSQDAEILFRADDGVAIAQRKKTVVLFGEDPNRKQSRVFIDPEHASRYLRNVVTLKDLTDRDKLGEVSLDERDGEPIIQLPDNAVEIPGGVRNFN